MKDVAPQQGGRSRVLFIRYTRLMLAGVAPMLVVAGVAPVGRAQPVRCQAPPEQVQRAAFNDFVDTLLIERAPRRAFEEVAVTDLKQHNPAFGADRESSIRQYEWMMDRPGSTFAITGVSFEAGLGTLRFRGALNPGQPGANIVAYFRFECGRIAETWDIMHFEAPPPASPSAD